MAERKYYCFCDSGCKFETMSKEQILAAITQAINDGTVGEIDTGFVTTIKTINGSPLRFFVGDQPTYNKLSDAEKENLFALITNDTSKEGITEALERLAGDVNGLKISVEKMLADVTKLKKDTKCELYDGYILPESGFYHIRVLIPAVEEYEIAEYQDFGFVRWEVGQLVTGVGRNTWFTIDGNGEIELTNTGGTAFEKDYLIEIYKVG